jgi:hypothetical protein
MRSVRRRRRLRSNRQTGKWSSSQSDHIRAYRKSALHHADLVALFVFNFWDAIGTIGELEDLLWSG